MNKSIILLDFILILIPSRKGLQNHYFQSNKVKALFGFQSNKVKALFGCQVGTKMSLGSDLI